VDTLFFGAQELPTVFKETTESGKSRISESKDLGEIEMKKPELYATNQKLERSIRGPTLPLRV